MMKWRRLVFLLLTIVLINGTTWVVVIDNQQNGVYPPDGDSIGIPLLSTLLISCVILPLIVTMGILRDQKHLERFRSWSLAPRLLSAVWALTAYIVVLLFAAGGVLYWVGPKHYWITLSYMILLCGVASLCVFDAKWLLSNWPLNRTRAKTARAG